LPRHAQELLQAFLTNKQITGIETDVADETRLLVTAPAATLTAGWPGYT
jgi:hypothetical protein